MIYEWKIQGAGRTLCQGGRKVNVSGKKQDSSSESGSGCLGVSGEHEKTFR